MSNRTFLPVVAPIQWNIMTELKQANAQNKIPSNCPPDKVFVPENFRNHILEMVHPHLAILVFSQHTSPAELLLVAVITQRLNTICETMPYLQYEQTLTSTTCWSPATITSTSTPLVPHTFLRKMINYKGD